MFRADEVERLIAATDRQANVRANARPGASGNTHLGHAQDTGRGPVALQRECLRAAFPFAGQIPFARQDVLDIGESRDDKCAAPG